jgi:acetyl esterase
LLRRGFSPKISAQISDGRTAMNDATPWVDPELTAAGQLLQSKGLVAPDRTKASLAEVRAATDRMGAFLGEGSVPLKNERDLSLPGPHGQVACRLYLPDDVERPALLVYAHGGGFMQGSIPSWDHFLRDLVRQSGAAALSVDYKLSPEVKFPVAFDEVVAMTRLAAREGAGFGIDPTRLAIGGDSAGANLALAAALAMRDAGETALKFQLLIYGCFSTDCDGLSWQRFGQGAGLSQTQMRWIWETYLERPEQCNDWRAAPAVGDLKGVAPAHLIVGSLDPLLDDSNSLHAKLKAAGVPCDLTVYQGLNHGFIRYGRLIGAAQRAVGECAAALKQGLAIG